MTVHSVPLPVSAPRASGTVRLCFVLQPGFRMLAVSAALEPLEKANQVLGRAGYDWWLASVDGAAVCSHEGWQVPVEAAIDPRSTADITLLCGEAPAVTPHARLLQDHLRRQWRMGRMVGGLGGGQRSLARAGILKGRRVALHWSEVPGFRVDWPESQPVQGTFCADGRILSCAGPLAAVDLMLHLLEQNHGPDLVQNVMDLCLIRARRQADDTQTASMAPRIGCRNPALLRAVEWIDQHFAEEFCLEGFVATSNVSQRQLQRLFRLHLDTTPVGYLARRRLNHARALLTETNMTVAEAAERSGFASAPNFSKQFSKYFGFPPSRTGREHILKLASGSGC